MFDLLVAGSVVLFLDQWSKSAAALHARQNAVKVGSLVSIRHTRSVRLFYNSNAARTALVLLWISAFVSGILLHRSGNQLQSHAAIAGLGAALGGAAGNLYDILRRRFVVDFVDLGWWPVFNLADVAIITGVMLALWPPP